MSNFVVSARKYRPNQFNDVIGQQHVSQTLKNAIQSQHLAQAFLFCGPRGVGKTTCARILAKVLNCLQPSSDMEPCNACDSCDSFAKNASLNIYELDAASNNSVEHIRALTEQVRFAPQSGKYKIYIIDEVHMLSTSAFNAFLKTLEEPPSYAIFILATTEKHKIIPTILSRCQIFDFNRITVKDIAEHLENICKLESIDYEMEALNTIAQKADGALRDALSIFDRVVSFAGKNLSYKAVVENLNILDYEYFFKVIEALLAEDASEMLLLFDRVLQKGFDGDQFINGLAEHLRNLMVCKDPRTASLLDIGGETQQKYHDQAKICSRSLLLSSLSIINDCDVQYKMARNKRLHVELCLLRLAYIMRALDPNTQLEEKKNLRPESGPQKIIKPKKEAPKETELPQPKVVKPVQDLQKTLQKKSGGLLNKMLNEVEAETEDSSPKGADLTLDTFQEFWLDYTKDLDSASIKSLYNSVTVLNIQDKVIHLETNSNRAVEYIQKDRTFYKNIIDHFKEKSLKLEFTIIEKEEQATVSNDTLPVTDREKYIYFLEMNPNLKDLQKKFELLPSKDK